MTESAGDGGGHRTVVFQVKLAKCSRVTTSDVPKEIPQTFVELTFPGVDKVKGPSVPFTPASGDVKEHYNLNFEHRVRMEVTPANLHRLVNTPLIVAIGMEKREFKACSLDIDLLDVVLGKQREIDLAQQALPGAKVDGPWVKEMSLFGLSVSVWEESGGEGGALQPSSVMTPEAGEACTVLSVYGESMGPLPESFVTAQAKVGEGNVIARISAVLPLGLTQRLALQVEGSSLDPESRSMRFPDRPVRYLLPDVSYLQRNLDDGSRIAVEMARAFSPAVKVDDIGEMAYRAVSAVDVSALLEPGRAEVVLHCPATMTVPDALTCLGPFFKESTLGPRRGPQDGKDVAKIDDDSQGRCPFVEAGTVAVLRLALSRPLLPPWERPLQPAVAVSDVLPPRPAPPPPPRVSALARFRSECRRLAREVAADYWAVAEASPEVGVTSAALWQARQKALKYDLNRSGKFLAVRAALKAHVQAVVSEKYHRGGELAPKEMADVYNDLYMTLCDEMRGALRDEYHPQPAPDHPAPTSEDRARMLRLADECEAVGATDRAEQLHLDRLAGCEDAETWMQYARFCARNNLSRRASEALKKVLEISPGREDALRALCFVLMDLGHSTDPLRFTHAEAIAHQLLNPSHAPSNKKTSINTTTTSQPLASDWAVLAAILVAQGPSRDREARNAVYEAKRLAKESAGNVANSNPDSKNPDASSNSNAQAAQAERDPFVRSAQEALDFALATVALGLLGAAKRKGAEWHGVEGEAERPVGGSKNTVLGTGEPVGRSTVVAANLCLAEAYLLRGAREEALAAARRAGQMAEPSDVRPNILKGHVYHSAGHMRRACQQYLVAVNRDASACSLTVFLRLADAMEAMGSKEGALTVLQKACKVAPCSTVWQRVGVGHYLAGACDKADMALAQANIMDDRNAVAWGWMVAVHLRQGRRDEAEGCLRFALKYGLSDASVLVEVARQYIAMGLYEEAASALRRALRAREDPQARLLLGETLLETGDVDAAARNLEAAVGAARAAVEAAPAPVSGRLGLAGDGWGAEENGVQVAAGEEEEAGADDAMDSGVVRAMEAMAAVEHRAAELLATLQ